MYAYRRYSNYERNRKMMLVIVALTFFVFISLGYNVKQLFDINYYQKVVTETQGVIANLIATPISHVVPMASSIIATPTVEEPKNNIQPAVYKPEKIEPKRSEVQCLAENIYYEAGNQSLVGKIAVGHVTINRMNNPKYPKTICGVVNQRIDGVCMFSWKCEEPRPIRNQRAWKESQRVAHELLSRDKADFIDITEGATHFHSVRVKPGWKHKPVTRIDDHIFYRQ